MTTTAYDAVVLAGGRARRLGGCDKPALEVGGRSLLDAVLAAVAGARTVVVVGPARPDLDVVQVQEQPPGAGPVAALQSGLARTTAPLVVLLAADLPFLTALDVSALLAAATPAGGALAVDSGGREQWLLGAWPRDLLVTAAAGVAAGAPLRAVLGGLPRTVVPTGRGATDCDTPDELEEARRGARRVG